jgi:hypothetical protein
MLKDLETGKYNKAFGPLAAASKPGDLPTMPDPTKNDPDGGPHLPTMPDPTHDPERGQQLPTDPDPEPQPPARIEDPPRSNEDRHKRWT